MLTHLKKLKLKHRNPSSHIIEVQAPKQYKHYNKQMSIDLYPKCIHAGLDFAASPDSDEEDIDEICEKIHIACDGMGTDTQLLLKSLGSCDPEMRCAVPKRYKERFQIDLKKLMKKEQCNNDFGIALQFLAVDPVHAECDMIRKAIKAPGVHEKVIFSIIGGRSSQELKLLKAEFLKLREVELETYLKSEFRSSIGHEIVKIILNTEERPYDNQFHTDIKCIDNVSRLQLMRDSKWDNVTELFKLISSSPPEFLNQINVQFEKENDGISFVAVADKELTGSIRKAALFIIGMKLNPYDEIAKLMKAATKGFGTDELLLSSNLIRYQCIMKDVMKSHERLFGKTVRDRINSETNLVYNKILMQIAETGEEYSCQRK